MRPWRALGVRAGVVVAAVLATVGVLSLSGEAHATAYRQVYLQFNMCGNVCSNGGLGVVDELRATVESRRPFAVTLNEMCENQFDHLRAGLPGYQGRFDPTGVNCRNGARYGNAALIRATEVTLVGSWLLPEPVRHEPRRLMCLGTRLPGAPSLLVCVTHISNMSGNIGPQVDAVAGIINGLAADHAVVLGGDFNTDPPDPRLDPLYRGCGSTGPGRFGEADAGGCGNRAVLNRDTGVDVLNEDTFDTHKLDYIFLSDGHWFSATADAGDSTDGSDHNPLWATTTFGR